MPLRFEKLSLEAGKGNPSPSEKVPSVSSPAGPPPSSEAPPTYSVIDSVSVPPAPLPKELSAAFANLNIPDIPPPLPTADHCLAHLKLLNSFHALKEDVGYTDGLFGLWDAACEVLQGKDRDAALAKTREKRWSLYLARAVERFEVWWTKYLCSLEDCKRLEGKEMLASSPYSEFTSRGRALKWTTSMLPPLGEDDHPGEIELLTDGFRYSYGLACIHA